MIIVGITGNIANGKTTLGEYLAAAANSARHWESWQVIADIATGLRVETNAPPPSDDLEAINKWLAPLPLLVEATVHKTLQHEAYRLTEQRVADHPDYYRKLTEYLQLMHRRPELTTVSITEDNKELFRNLLQWLGGYLVELLGEGTWYDEILHRIKVTQGIELATIGGVRFPGEAQRIKQAGGWIIGIARPQHAIRDITDLTERQRILIKPDALVINNGGLADLADCAKQLYQDLRIGRLQTSYLAKASVAS